MAKQSGATNCHLTRHWSHWCIIHSLDFGGLTLLQALRDLPAGCNRGYLEWASIANASKSTRVLEKVRFWENASPIISCLISSWKSERAPGHPSSSKISVRGDKNVKKPIWAVICDAHKWGRYAESVGLKKKAKKEKGMNIDSPVYMKLSERLRDEERERKRGTERQGFWEMPNFQQYKSHKRNDSLTPCICFQQRLQANWPELAHKHTHTQAQMDTDGGTHKSACQHRPCVQQQG